MADKTIGSLPAAPDLYDDSLLPVEQQGQAVKLTGAQIKGFARQGVSQYVQAAQDAASEALEAVGKVGDSVAQAQTAAQTAQEYSGKPPVIQNGTWWTWNAEAKAYQDTGKPAQGPQGEQGIQGIQGPEGKQGPIGPQGQPGADGTSFVVKGRFDTLAELESAHPAGQTGDAYAVGTPEDNTVYLWSADAQAWQDVGSLQGPEGPEGKQGPVGPQGPPGSTEAADAAAQAAQTAAGQAAAAAAAKQDKLTGTAGQVVGFNAEGEAVAQPGVGRSMSGQTVEPVQGETVTAGTGAEIFNDYRARTFGTNGAASTGNIASGSYSHAEGCYTTASGAYAHAEGRLTIASGQNSHAEGLETKASGTWCPHAEGWKTEATGSYTHVEGHSTTASGDTAHAEGFHSKATKNSAHAEGNSTTASGDSAHAEGTSTKAQGSASHAEGGSTTASGDVSHAEGSNTSAEGDYSHSEGNSTTSAGESSHAEGSSTSAFNKGDHAEGINSIAGVGDGTTHTSACHAEGCGTKATGDNGSHAEGERTTASALSAHAEGWLSEASGAHAHAEGSHTAASGDNSHAEGSSTAAKGVASHAGGVNTIANDYQTVVGTYNVEKAGGVDNDRFIVGGGWGTPRKNAFRVHSSGACYGSGAWNSSGADYAELFEWLDGNPNAEDRAGLFVTLESDRLRLAGPEDDFVLGIVSADPSVVGDVYDDQWAGMYLRDVFGRTIMEMQDFPAETTQVPREDGTMETVELIPARRELAPKLNPDYDHTIKYLPRTQRPEWDAVGMMGKLVAVDDGTCQVNGWCAVGEGGKATHSDARTRYRVMARLDDTHIRVLIL